MQTNFSENQLKDKDNQSTEKIFKKCVHCGMCNATCPTYGILGDELDGPRGRIYLIQDMLENEKKPTEKVVKHIDRCLSCYSYNKRDIYQYVLQLSLLVFFHFPTCLELSKFFLWVHLVHHLKFHKLDRLHYTFHSEHIF